jgi:DNA-binding beta-propeller fold protein YncE
MTSARPRSFGLFASGRPGHSVFVLLLLAAKFCGAQTQTPPQFAFTIMTNAASGAIWPTSLGSDVNGNLYVSGTGRVLKLSAGGNLLNQWGSSGTGAGQFAYPSGFAFDSAHEVFVTDQYNNRVQKFTADGVFLLQWGSYGTNAGQFNYPAGIGVDTDDNVYVVDFYNARVQKFHANGSFISQWGGIGDGPGQFDFPQALAVDASNHVYVTDTTTNSASYRVQRFTQDGTYVTGWYAHGSNAAGFSEMGGIVTDRSNSVYVADAANNLIQKYDSNGNFLTQWGTLGTGPGQFNTPSGIAVEPGGNYIYVSDYYNDRIEVFAYTKSAPLLYGQPLSQTVPAGVNVTFSVGVFGATPLAYQWLLNGTNLAGASGATLTVSNVSLADSGSVYSVLVGNMFGGDSSSNAVLTVLPAVPTTLPASGISATGAVLNGSVALGAYLTQTWFEWGTDVNYGNTTGTTNIAASNALVALRFPLNGLSGTNMYHYRVAASNSQGLAYGADQVFAVGLKPTVTTLGTTGTTATGATLNGTVNPQGLDTIAFFRWGTSTYYGHTTAALSLGGGASALGVSSAITGLDARVLYHCQAVASNRLGLVTGADVSFTVGSWVLANVVPRTGWTSLSMSADGSQLAAVTADMVLSSSDAGITWGSNNAAGSWMTLASSADGVRLVAGPGASTGPIYFSTNSGAHWTQSSAPFGYWAGVASSGDGLRLSAVNTFGRSIYTSTNGGLTWTSNNAPNLFYWAAVASSADGLRLVAAAGGAAPGNGAGPIYSSSNGGLTWSSNSAPRNYWRSLACSADGAKIVVAAGWTTTAYTGPIYASADYGLTWNPTGAPVTNWQSVVCSADGTRLAAVSYSGDVVYTSTNSGTNWTLNTLPGGAWANLASSADGGELAAATSQNIFLWHGTVPPTLSANLAAGKLALSWIIPSAPFVLQRSLTASPPNWVDLTNSPSMAPTTLRNQVIVAPADPAAFYRLRKM